MIYDNYIKWLKNKIISKYYCIISGNMAAFDMDDPKSIVSPGGVGFDINCGVRLLRTNLFESDVLPVKVIFFKNNFLIILYMIK